MSIPVETFFLNPDSTGTLQARIQQMIAEGILSGYFQKGEKLPSSRRLAQHLGVSRITVTLAYTELQASDYLEARDRSGYYVSQNAPEPPRFPASEPRRDVIDWSRALGRRFVAVVGAAAAVQRDVLLLLHAAPPAVLVLVGDDRGAVYAAGGRRALADFGKRSGEAVRQLSHQLGKD